MNDKTAKELEALCESMRKLCKDNGLAMFCLAGKSHVGFMGCAEGKPSEIASIIARSMCEREDVGRIVRTAVRAAEFVERQLENKNKTN